MMTKKNGQKAGFQMNRYFRNEKSILGSVIDLHWKVS